MTASFAAAATAAIAPTDPGCLERCLGVRSRGETQQMDIGLRPLSPRGDEILDELESDYGVRARERLADGERRYKISNPTVAQRYERHLAGYDPDWASEVSLSVH